MAIFSSVGRVATMLACWLYCREDLVLMPYIPTSKEAQLTRRIRELQVKLSRKPGYMKKHWERELAEVVGELENFKKSRGMG